MARQNVARISKVDRISELPDDIREFLLGFLPITDAVRTSALARKWRYTWTKVSQLNIHFEDDDDSDINIGDGWLYKVIGNVLLCHDGFIEKFVLRINDGCIVTQDLNAWLLAVSRKGVKDLTLQSGHCNDGPDLPSSLYKCGELTSLTLEYFVWRESLAFKSFPNLVSLKLESVEFESGGTIGDILGNIVSSCPLEILFILSCTFNSTSMDHVLHHTVINAPSLRELNIACTYSSLEDICLKNTPNVRVVSLELEPIDDMDIEPLTSDCFVVLDSMPKIEDFTFDCRLHKVSTSDTIPKRLTESLIYLKTFSLYNLDVISLDQMSFVFCVIRNSPNLQNLSIGMEVACGHPSKINNNSLKRFLEFLKAESKEETELNLAKLSVTFEDPNRIEAEIALIHNIVSLCHTLGTLFVKSSRLVQKHANLRLSRAVRWFGRSPSNPEIIYE